MFRLLGGENSGAAITARGPLLGMHRNFAISGELRFSPQLGHSPRGAKRHKMDARLAPASALRADPSYLSAYFRTAVTPDLISVRSVGNCLYSIGSFGGRSEIIPFRLANNRNRPVESQPLRCGDIPWREIADFSEVRTISECKFDSHCRQSR